MGVLGRHEEPVQAQSYQPQLGTPYEMILPKEDIIAQSRAAQRLMGYNPAAQAAIAAQSYTALNDINAKQFMANQAMKDKVYGENRAILNDAKIRNLQIYDQQATNQAKAKSNTDAEKLAAQMSIAAKYQQNKLEKRKIQIDENMYNYRVDDKGRMWNWNPLAQFNTQGSTSNASGVIKNAEGEELYPIYTAKGDIKGYTVKQETKTTAKGKYGMNIARAMKHL
jgi:hypothetical protein